MSDFVDPFAKKEELSERVDIGIEASEVGAPEPLPRSDNSSAESGSDSTLRSDPEKPGKTIRTPADVPKIVQDVLAERRVPSLVAANSPPPQLSPQRRSAKNQRGKKVVERGDGKCTAYAQIGTKCKFCGKVHPL